MIHLFHIICKTYLSFVSYLSNWFHWGYEKRYLYHLDGVEKRRDLVYLSMHIRGKRVGFTIPINSINEELINEMHPVDACFIGALSISTDKNIVYFLENLYSSFKEKKQPLTTVKTDPILTVTNILSLQLNEEKLMIYPNSGGLSAAVEIKLDDIVSNPLLLTGLGSKSAFKVGQEVSRKITAHEKNFKH